MDPTFAASSLPTYENSQAVLTAGHERGNIIGLREQIKSNAGLLFPHAAGGLAQLAYDVVVTHASDSKEKDGQPSYQALLTYGAGSIRKNFTTAKGPLSPSVEAALQGLLDVTAAALFRYEEHVVRDLGLTVQIGGGEVDEQLIVGKSWKEVFGGKK